MHSHPRNRFRQNHTFRAAWQICVLVDRPYQHRTLIVMTSSMSNILLQRNGRVPSVGFMSGSRKHCTFCKACAFFSEGDCNHLVYPLLGTGSAPREQDTFNGSQQVALLRNEKQSRAGSCTDKPSEGPGHCLPIKGNKDPSLLRRERENFEIAQSAKTCGRGGAKIDSGSRRMTPFTMSSFRSASA